MFPAGIFLMLIAVGLVPVGVQLVEGGDWGAAPSIGLLLMFFSAFGLVERALHAPAKRDVDPRPCTPASPGCRTTYETKGPCMRV